MLCSVNNCTVHQTKRTEDTPGGSPHGLQSASRLCHGTLMYFAIFLLLIISLLFPHPSYIAVDTRAVAGIVLKNNIKKTYEQLSAQAPQILEDVKTQCMLHIGDASQLIRATVGLIITMMVQEGDLASWPALLPTLLQLIRNPNPNICQVRIRGLNPSRQFCEVLLAFLLPFSSSLFLFSTSRMQQLTDTPPRLP